MATEQECRQALQTVMESLRKGDGPSLTGLPDRTLSCTVTDLNVVFTGQLQAGQLGELSTITPEEAAASPAQIRLKASSDDLIALASKQLSLPAAWMSGRVSIKASLTDLMKLRNLT
jgi:hypothetical protein